MSENETAYCYHCLAKVEDSGGDYCAECGKRHSVHYGQSYELPAGTYLSDGRYFVGESIGSGGFGISYIGYDLKLERKILIKETFYNGIFRRNAYDPDNPEPLKVTYGNEFSLDDIMRKTKKECISLSEGEGLNNIVKVYDWFSENNTAYIITEFIDGVTLYERVREHGCYSWEDYYAKMRPLMVSLSKLHKKGIIHRDIKPQNIMIRNISGIGEEFILIDFGLARSMETKTLASVGVSFSPGYSPYEQRSFLSRDGEYTDVYSLAATSYFALTGEDPNLDMEDTMEGNFPEIRNMSEVYAVPENVVKGLMFALNPNYRQRCQTVDELMRYFDKLTHLQNIKEANKNTPPITRINDADKYNSNTLYKSQNGGISADTSGKNYDGIRAAATQENRERAREAAKQREYDRIIQEAKDSINLPVKPEQNSGSKKPLIIAAAAVAAVVFVLLVPVRIGVNKAKLSTMKSDSESLCQLIEEAVNEYRAGLTDVTWNGETAENASVHDICIENDIDDSTDFYIREIGGTSYSMVWTYEEKLEIKGGKYDNNGSRINGRTAVSDIAYYGNSGEQLSVLESDTATMSMLIKEAVNTYKARITTTKWNGKTAAEATVHDICVENDIDDSGEFYTRTIAGIEYSMVWSGDDPSLKISGGTYDNAGKKIDGSVSIVDLDY